MQEHFSLLKDIRGCMTRFDPLTPEIVEEQSDDGMTFKELQDVLAECGLDISKVVFDCTRVFQNAFYADFEHGHYCWIPFQKAGLKDVISIMDQQFKSDSFGAALRNREWTTFYMLDVPLPMQIYDFERRYLKMYNLPTRELAKRVIDDVRHTVGTVSTCGIGTNMFLAKVALDIQAKHAPDFIGELDENQYREKLWDHKPLTDFWGIGPGTAKRLWNRGITTMGGIAQCDINRIYDWFGIDGELLYDHAWGKEPTTIADVKAYKSKAKSLSAGQVLMRDYSFSEAEIIAKEMMDQLCLDMAAKKLATDSVGLYIGYSYTYGVPGVGGTAQLAYETNAASVIVPAIGALYRRIVNPAYGIRRVCLCCNNVVVDQGHLQLNMFEDTTKQLKSKALQEAMLGIRAKYGKNSILRGISFTPESTARERNLQIGGHKSGIEDSSRTHGKVKTG